MTLPSDSYQHKTGIQWTHVPGYVGATWNPTVGCTRVSPGCDNCYAFQLHDQRYAVNVRAALASGDRDMKGREVIAAARAAGVKLPMAPQYDVPFSTVQMLDEKRLTAPLRVRKPHAYFVDSMADLFHEDVTDEFLHRVWAVMAGSPHHLYMILTKRPERMRRWVGEVLGATLTDPLKNVWLGVSAEDQQRADERTPVLLDTPAAVRFVSYEPALGPVDFRAFLHCNCDGDEAWGAPETHATSCPYRARLHWIIVGGESGPRARPFDLAWARSVVGQCRDAGVATFVKQLGAHPRVAPYRELLLRSRHGSDPAEWPEDLRVRDFPDAPQ